MTDVDVKEMKVALAELNKREVPMRRRWAKPVLPAESDAELRELFEDDPRLAKLHALLTRRHHERRVAFRAARVEQAAQAEDEDPAAAAKIADAFEAERTALQLLAQEPRVQTFVTLDKPLFIEQLPIADLSQFPDHHIEPFNSWFKVNIATNSGPRHKGGTSFVGYYLWENPSDHYAVGTATATMTLNGTASLGAAPGGLLRGDYAGLVIETSLKARRWTGWGTDSAGNSLDGTTYPVDATKQVVFWFCYGGDWEIGPWCGGDPWYGEPYGPNVLPKPLNPFNHLTVPTIAIPARASIVFELGLLIDWRFSNEFGFPFPGEDPPEEYDFRDELIVDLASKEHMARCGAVLLDLQT
jgi:hypothetical protein